MKILTNVHVSYSKPQFKKQKSLLNFQQHIKGKSFNKLESMQKKAVWQCENTLTYTECICCTCTGFWLLT